jgi:hypothetical protein
MAMRFLILIGTIFTFTFPALGGKMHPKQLNQDEAFQALQRSLTKLSTEDKALAEYSWILKMKNWEDSKPYRYHPQQSSLFSGKELSERPDTPTVGTKILVGSRNAFKKTNHYWMFSWLSPGVIDRSCTFYVDAENGELVFATTYSSPD